MRWCSRDSQREGVEMSEAPLKIELSDAQYEVCLLVLTVDKSLIFSSYMHNSIVLCCTVLSRFISKSI